MRILVTGATGFIGNAIFHSLVAEHTVTIGSRSPIDGYEKWKHVDFSAENNWDDLLTDIHMVVNAIGIAEGDFGQVQTRAPLRLFEACTRKGIKVINISAIGAEKDTPSTPFLQSKKKADDYLLDTHTGKIIYPGIVLGKGAQSMQFFAEMAALPVIPLIRSNPVPVVHISDLAALVRQVTDNFEKYPSQIFAVSKAEPLKKILTVLRGKNALFITLPSFFFTVLFTLFPKIRIGIFDKNMMTMLSSVSAEDYKPTGEDVLSKVRAGDIVASSYIADLVAVSAISFIWLWSAISSVFSWNESLALMKEIGVNRDSAPFFIYAGCIADFVLGFAIFWKKKRKQVLALQILFIVIYSLILTIFAPQYWMHPLGPLSKNIPLIALTFYLYLKKK